MSLIEKKKKLEIHLLLILYVEDFRCWKFGHTQTRVLKMPFSKIACIYQPLISEFSFNNIKLYEMSDPKSGTAIYQLH